MLNIGFHITRFFSSLSHVACVSIVCDEHGEYEYTCVCFERNKKEFKQTHKTYTGSSIAELLTCIPSHYPVVLFVDGKGIISRYVSGTFQSTNEVLLQFPDFNDNSFVQCVTILQDCAIVSVARTQLINTITQQLQGKKIIHIEMGAGIYASCISLFSNNLYVHSIPLWHILFENNTIQGIEKKEKHADTNIIFGNETICTSQLYAYCLAILCFQPQFLQMQLNTYVDTAKNNFANTLRSKRLAIVAIAVFLCVLLANTLVFNAFYAKHQQLQFQVSQHNSTLRTLQQMQQEYEQKKALFSHVNIYKSGGFPYFFDRLGMVLPRDVVLQKMWCNPLQKDIKSDKEIVFNSNIITVYGIAPQITSIYTWIELLKQEPWVQSVELVDYSNAPQGSSAQFILKIGI